MRRILFQSLLVLVSCTALAGQNALAEAEQLATAEQYASSSAALLNFIEDHPQRKHDIARAWWLHSQNQLALGEIDAARAANDSSLLHRNRLRSRDIAENYWLRGKIELGANRADRALEALNLGMNFLIEDPLIFADLHVLSGRAYAALNHKDDAQDAFATAFDILSIELGDSHEALADLYFQWGQALHLMQELGPAREKWIQAYHIFPNGWQKATTALWIWRITHHLRYQE